MWISEEHLSVLFYATPFLVKTSRPLSHFGIFIGNKEEGVSQIFLRILLKKKIWAIKRLDVLAQGTVMLCLYYYVFLMSSYILKMLLLAMLGKLVLLESRLCQWNNLKKDLHKDALEKNWRNRRDTRRCFKVIRCLYDVAWLKLMRVLIIIY